MNITYPSVIHVVCDDDVEDCSDRATSSAGGMVQDEVWNLNPAAPQQSTMQKGKWTTKSGAVHGIVFDNLRTPRVYQDSSGRWYVRYSNSPTGNVYIDEVIPTFKATYTRQSVTCTCPSDTNLEGTTFTLLDKYSYPAGTPEASMFAGVLGGSDEWKTTYCGGLKPVYGCKDTRATNYNSNPDVVKDPTDNDVCNPNTVTTHPMLSYPNVKVEAVLVAVDLIRRRNYKSGVIQEEQICPLPIPTVLNVKVKESI